MFLSIFSTFARYSPLEFRTGNNIVRFAKISNLLTYLFGRYNLGQVLASANLRRHTSRAGAA